MGGALVFGVRDVPELRLLEVAEALSIELHRTLLEYSLLQ
jgi:hypothetical protein